MLFYGYKYTFMTTSRLILHRLRNTSHKSL